MNLTQNHPVFKAIDFLNAEILWIRKSEKELVEDVEFLKKAPVWRQFVAIPDMVFAQWRHNRRVKRYHVVYHIVERIVAELNDEANRYLDREFNQKFDDLG